ncbi:Clavaminate synthase-like protein [Mycena crocata]|nr:Clavaminate synthase-like protein [Mycena crocata]
MTSSKGAWNISDCRLVAIPQVQQRKCTSYQGLTPCVTCRRHHSKEQCRFQNLRSFMVIEGKIGDMSFHSSEDNLPIEYATSWNIPTDRVRIAQMKRGLAPALLAIMRRERAHLDNNPIRRPMDMSVRMNCDLCTTSIFSASWLCRNCGRDICNSCLDQLRTAQDLEVRKQLLMENPNFDQCSFGVFHEALDFIALTRLRRAEIESSILQMEGLTAPVARLPQTYTPIGVVDNGLPIHLIQRVANRELTEDIFHRLWAQGEPILVTQAKTEFKLPWNPKYFIRNYGTDQCTVVNCHTDVEKKMTVTKFFKTFGKYTAKRECLKLKDWPPSSDFSVMFPPLYRDFEKGVPVAHHVRTDGIANVAAYFPRNGIAPDLGPKMYNAHGNISGRTVASTRLHMDMADALNILMHAEVLPNGKPGGATWDIFRAEDAQQIRHFLRSEFPNRQVDDPIHGQEVFITDELLLRMHQTCGVKSYRVHQKVGEAIMIPAGCAHQVRNLSDCIKVAVDFVSIANIQRCDNLTEEFRAVNNGGKPWKADVLQLKSLLWFAWATLCHQENTNPF